mmetsp:Transcript_34646/g.84008  ORF Transcript_34646/g.84008 Transcript_34646/m.84008 type:complete len:920 (+) Transcript_34646:423-3182(+)|eukprot:CAMPEP_0113623934 /NCGR_PEP_ID=MMETSP0017_2-20120614/12331_1 /TAXON_ID=2856 /ORGANISM="Cylindrotheca closterium" /LENGTH=919 /DNA_ID=CAMNT_0000533935 /DNA_START=267 /DNA_END=3026 /DNA_ORIENTATION=+ /assembly_acc=CAM_ASM_000147
MTTQSDTKKMKVKDTSTTQAIKEQDPNNEGTQGEQNKTRRKKGFGLSKKTIGRFKRSFKKSKNKSESGSNDNKISTSEHVESTSESRDHRTETKNNARLSHTDTRTTVSSHFELPNPQQKEMLQLTNENTKLQEQINKANDDNRRLKHEILQQRMEFQQQKNDLEQQIQTLKQKLALSDNASPNQIQNQNQNKDSSPHTETSPMIVDFAGDVVPLDDGEEEEDEERIGALPGKLPGQFPEFQSMESSDDEESALMSPDNKARRFISEDPRQFQRTVRRSALNPPPGQQNRRNTVQSAASKTRRQGVKLATNRGVKDMHRDSTALGSRGTIGTLGNLDEGIQLMDFVKQERMAEWCKTFRRSDPRYQILNFFDDIAQEGADNMDKGFDPVMASPLLRIFDKASVFTVWRPTSLDAIRRMMLGEGVGKGLDIKGKSAKRGRLSGYVPYLQIYEQEHKRMVKTHPKDGKIKVFFKREIARNQVVAELNTLAKEMVETFAKATEVVAQGEADDDVMEWHLQRLIWEMTDTQIDLIDDYAPSTYGMLVPERLFWEGMVVRQDISRAKDSEYYTGRPSEPNFQNMNSLSLRKEPKNGGPKTVILQYEAPGDVDPDPMDPRNLVMAYEENGRIMPVVSDFDCFLVGSRGVRYEEPMDKDQLSILKWCVDQIETVLDSGAQSKSWTSRWLDILKVEASKGFHPTIPPLGFSDPKSNNIMKYAINRLKKEGSVRHGAECFNYYFPQELDDEFLVISHDLPGSLRWCYVDEQGLLDVLSKQIDKGYTFPINPKWILCDEGWKAIYDKLMASQRANVQDSLRMWYPPEMGIREKIEEIHSRHPNGFQRVDENQRPIEEEEPDGTAAMDLAEQELRAYLTFQRAKRKLRGIFVWRRLLLEMRKGYSKNEQSSATLLGDIRSSKTQLDVHPV